MLKKSIAKIKQSIVMPRLPCYVWNIIPSIKENKINIQNVINHK